MDNKEVNQENTVTLSKEDLEKTDSAGAERQRLIQLILEKQAGMVLEYRTLNHQTGSYLNASMGYAYSKGINDIIKLIARSTNESI